MYHAMATTFGDAWSRFDQCAGSEAEATKIFDEYFAIFL